MSSEFLNAIISQKFLIPATSSCCVSGLTYTLSVRAKYSLLDLHQGKLEASSANEHRCHALPCKPRRMFRIIILHETMYLSSAV